MAYNGFGYGNYSNSDAREQNQSSYTSSPIPKSAETALQNNNQQYGQRDAQWSRHDVPGKQTSNGQDARGGNYWMSNGTLNQQPINYQRQPSSYHASSLYQTVTSARQYNNFLNPAQTSQHTKMQGTNAYGVGSTSNMGDTSSMDNTPGAGTTNNIGNASDMGGNSNMGGNSGTGGTPTMGNTSSMRGTSNLGGSPNMVGAQTMGSTSSAIGGASNNGVRQRNNVPANTQYATTSSHSQAYARTASPNMASRVHQSRTVLHNPDSAQNPRTVAATAMAALSSASQRNYNQNSSTPNTYLISNSNQYKEKEHISASNTVAARSTDPLPPQHRIYETPVASSPSPSLPQQQVRNMNNSRPQAAPTQNYPANQANSTDAQPTIPITRIQSTMSLDHNQADRTHSAEPSPTVTESNTQTPLPRFVDPTNIYNPYYRQFNSTSTAGATPVQATTEAATEQPSLPPTPIVAHAESPQVVTHNEPTQSAAPAMTPPEAATTAQAPPTKKSKTLKKAPRKSTSKDDTPKKTKKRKSTTIPATSEENTTTQGIATSVESAASQMQKMLDELRKKDPEAFQTLLAANLSKADVSQQTFVDNAPNAPSSSAIPQQPTLNADTMQPSTLKPTKRRASAKRAPKKVSIENSENPVHVSEGTPNTSSLVAASNSDLQSTAQAGPSKPKRKRKPKAKATNEQAERSLQADTQPLPVDPQLTAPREYTSLSVEEQRLSLLENFTKVGHAEMTPASSVPNQTLSADDTPATQTQNPTANPATHPPPPQTSAAEKQSKDKAAVSFWPEHKRRVLAQSACEYIASLPGNQEISSDFVLGLIEQNLSYIQLCQKLEGSGYTLNKVNFAKHLLQAFPDLGDGKPKPEARQASMQPPQSSLPVSSFVSTSPPQSSLPVSSFVSTSPPVGAVVQAKGTTLPQSSKVTTPLSRDEQRQKFLNLLHLNRRTKSAAQRRTSISASPAPQPREPLANSKEALARKRTFAELVDLSQDLTDDEEDEEDVVHTEQSSSAERSYQVDQLKQPVQSGQAERPSQIEQQNQVKVTIEDPMDTSLDGPSLDLPTDVSAAQPLSSNTNAQQTRALMPPPAIPPVSPRPAQGREDEDSDDAIELARFQHPEPPPPGRREELRRYSGIVKPVNKAKALKRSYYDPRTIARDILIAAGRHPTERPLNHHLLKLKERFQYVDFTSDFETFRWDLVDPGGPPAPTVSASMPIVTQPRLGSREREKPASHDPTSGSELAHFPGATTSTSDLSLQQSQQRPHLTAETITQSGSMAPPSSFPTSLPTRRKAGRPPGAKNKPKPVPKPHVQVTINAPGQADRKCQIYECHYDSCGAKLHNFDIYRKHVLKLHGRPDEEPVPCRWIGCDSAKRAFTQKALVEHLDRAHVSPLAWELGDGPRNISSGETGKFNQPIVIS